MRNSAPTLQYALLVSAAFTLSLWALHPLTLSIDFVWQTLAIYPRRPDGLLGIVTAPLLHGSWQHLIGNSLPLLLFGTLLLYGYPRSRWPVLVIIWLWSGLGVWLFARPSFHLGASGITHGLFFFLFVAGALRRDKRSIALLMIAFFMYGSMLLTILPREPDISYEYHFFGAMAGAACALAFYRREPQPARRRYSWQRENDSQLEIEDPVIGDQWMNERQRKTRDSQLEREQDHTE